MITCNSKTGLKKLTEGTVKSSCGKKQQTEMCVKSYPPPPPPINNKKKGSAHTLKYMKTLIIIFSALFLTSFYQLPSKKRTEVCIQFQFATAPHVRNFCFSVQWHWGTIWPNNDYPIIDSYTQIPCNFDNTGPCVSWPGGQVDASRTSPTAKQDTAAIVYAITHIESLKN